MRPARPGRMDLRFADHVGRNKVRGPNRLVGLRPTVANREYEAADGHLPLYDGRLPVRGCEVHSL
jgi:hypothetical protein